MKRAASVVIAVLWGVLLGFFGVFASVFSDGGLQERLITIAVILSVYFVSSGIWAFFSSFQTWKWSLVISTPGMLILLLYSFSESSQVVYFIIYLALIQAFSMLGTKFGIRHRKTRKL